MRILNRILVSLSFLVMAGFTGSMDAQQASQGASAARLKSSPNTNSSGGGRSIEALEETIAFRFAIVGLETNHQFGGQRNTFHVEYEYSGNLKGGGYDPQGHPVSAASFPYFQSVRNDIIQFATEYPDKNDFYEIFGTNICRFVLRKYPQIRKITLSIDVPAYKEVDVDRGETITVVRQASRRPRPHHNGGN